MDCHIGRRYAITPLIFAYTNRPGLSDRFTIILKIWSFTHKKYGSIVNFSDKNGEEPGSPLTTAAQCVTIRLHASRLGCARGCLIQEIIHMIEFTNVVKSYEQGNNALNGVSMQIEDGEFCFLIGPSGSGKSTIIKLISGELKPTSGTVHVNGYSLERIRKREIPYLRRTVGVVFQDYRLIDKMTVYENVAFAMRVVGAREREIKERVPYVLELVGLESKMNRHPHEMSGGEQQRLAIARALVNNPSTIIADEPTGNLDPERSFEIMALLQEINNLGTTMLVVTHDQNLVRLFHKRVISIDEGRVVSDGAGEEEINEAE